MKTTGIVIAIMLGLWAWTEFCPWWVGGYQVPGLPQRRPKRDDDEMDLLQQRLWPDGWEHLLGEPQDDTNTSEGTHQ